MVRDHLSGKLAVILHADVAGSTQMVQQDEHLAHERIQDTFRRFSSTINEYSGLVLELRGDALLAEFERPSDAVSAALAFQSGQSEFVLSLNDDLKPVVRVGIAMGEVVVADNTITGAGVVMAQRVEQLADAGSLCITAAVRESLSGRLSVEFESLGQQDLKGFEEPVGVYKVGLAENTEVPLPAPVEVSRKTSSPWKYIGALTIAALVFTVGIVYWVSKEESLEETASIERMAFPLPDKPSIAVLPFTNMSNDTEQEFFADGMTEDLITDISKIAGLFVIARNSVFTYKGKPVKVRQVAEELGVRYVLEGSVRRSGDQVRINAQLIDATTGGHLWADRYDGSLNDVFAMQDSISQEIVSALAVTITGQNNNDRQDETELPDAYDAFLRGWERYRLGTPEDLANAKTFFEQAIELDPNYARAHSALAAAYWTISLNGWSRNIDLLPFEAREISRLTIRKAMEQPSALTHQIASERAAYFYRRADRALAEAKLAIALDANDPAGHLAMATAESVHTAMRFDPHYPAFYLTRLGMIQFTLEQYDKAADTLQKAANRNPDDDWTFVYLAAAYGQLGDKEKALKAVDRANALRAKSGWGALTLQTVGSHSTAAGRRYYFKWFGDYKPMREGLLKAGVTSEVNWSALINRGESNVDIKGTKKIDVETAKAMHERGVPFVNVDFKWQGDRIPGDFYLENWSYEFNESRLSEIVGKTQEVVIYSRGSDDFREAPEAVARAVTWGYEKVYYFREGLNGWKAAGYPVEKAKSNSLFTR